MICAYCGGHIPEGVKGSRGPRSRFCSDECAKAAHREYVRDRTRERRARERADAATKEREPLIKACKYCGKSFETFTNQRYCSLKCRQDAKNERDRKKRQLHSERDIFPPIYEPKNVELTNKIAELRAKGQTYAEYQRAKLIKQYAHVEL